MVVGMAEYLLVGLSNVFDRGEFFQALRRFR